MSAVTDLLNQMRAKHDALNEKLAQIPESRMGEMGSWGDRQMPIRTMFLQMVGHDVEHTVQAIKTRRDLGMPQTEAQATLARLQEVRGQLEGLIIGLSDEDLDKAPEGEWSMRQVLEHFMQTEDFYGSRLEQALSGS
jgi:uncharacterized damage-inducible protein DinB